MSTQLPAAVLRVSWRDATASLSTTRAHLRPASIAANLSAAGDLVATMQPCTGCACPGYSISYQFLTAPAAASGPAPVQWRGLLVFRCTGSDEYLVMEVPGIKAALIDPDAPTELLQTASELQDLAQFVISSGFCNPFAAPAEELVAAFVQFVP